MRLPYGDPVLRRQVHAVALGDTERVHELLELLYGHVDAGTVRRMGVDDHGRGIEALGVDRGPDIRVLGPMVYRDELRTDVSWCPLIQS